jgi:hypothetical protein
VTDLLADLVAHDPVKRPAGAGQAAARARGLLHHPMRPLAGEAGQPRGILLRDPLPELPQSA